MPSYESQRPPEISPPSAQRVPDRVKFNYEPGPTGTYRPYLWLDMRTEVGTGIQVRGLLDTGADVTLLDSAYLSALGLNEADLEPVYVDGPAGKLTGGRSRTVVLASLPGAPGNAAPLRPIFTDAAGEVRWGRDFMSLYAVAFDEQSRQFSLYSRQLTPTRPRVC